MKELLDLVFGFQLRLGFKSIAICYSFSHGSPCVREGDCAWSKHDPVSEDMEDTQTRQFYLSKERLFTWLTFVLQEGFVQFGPHIYVSTVFRHFYGFLLCSGLG